MRASCPICRRGVARNQLSSKRFRCPGCESVLTERGIHSVSGIVILSVAFAALGIGSVIGMKAGSWFFGQPLIVALLTLIGGTGTFFATVYWGKNYLAVPRLVVERGWHCEACEYDLRASLGPKCPECGHPFTPPLARPPLESIPDTIDTPNEREGRKG